MTTHVSLYPCLQFLYLTRSSCHGQELAHEKLSNNILRTAGSTAATSNTYNDRHNLTFRLHTRNMGHTTNWRKAACLWACILLSFKCICFATTLSGQVLTGPQFTCFDGDLLCPILHGEPTLRCGVDCFLPVQYS